MADDNPHKPIELHMSSYGGDTYAMLRLHDFMLACPCQFKFYGGGPVMSSASFIMAASDERYLYENAVVMVHELSDDSGPAKYSDIKINASENDRLMDVLSDIYACNSRMPKEFWMDVLQKDVYLTAREAVSLGLVDKIIEPKKRGNLRKVRQAALNKTPDSKDMKKLVTDIYSRIGRAKVPKLEFNDIKKEATDPSIIVASDDIGGTEQQT